MVCKCKFISCGQMNRKIISIIFGALFYTSTLYLESVSGIFSGKNPHPIVYTLIYSLGLCLSFILFIVYKIRNKSHKNNVTSSVIEENFNNTTLNSSSNNKMVSKKEKFLWILLVSIIDYIAFCINSIFWITSENYVNNWATNFLFITLFSYFILKVKLYKHHFISIGIIEIIGLFFNIPLGVFSADNIKKYYPYYLSYILTGIAFSLTYVIYKHMMIKKYIKTHEILFFEGVIVSLLGIITLIITTSSDSIDNFFDFLEKLKGIEILITILLLFSRFLFHLLIVIIIDIFSPFYVFFLYMIGETIIFFADITEKDFSTIIIGFICLFIAVFTILVFLELIELNCFGLSKMTKKNIELRAQLDSADEEKDYVDEKLIAYKGYEFELKSEESKEKNELLPLD